MALAISMFLLLLAGCYSTKIYRGDGRIAKVRVGSWLSNCTFYEVSLGSIDFTKKGRKVFSLQGLPHEEMCLGFQAKVSDQNRLTEDDKSDAIITIILVDDAGRIVIHEQERLNLWTWSGDYFVYHRGGDNEKNTARLKVVDEAHGTYFKPRSSTRYILTIEIIEPDSKGKYDNAMLKVKNVRWCD